MLNGKLTRLSTVHARIRLARKQKAMQNIAMCRVEKYRRKRRGTLRSIPIKVEKEDEAELSSTPTEAREVDNANATGGIESSESTLSWPSFHWLSGVTTADNETLFDENTSITSRTTPLEYRLAESETFWKIWYLQRRHRWDRQQQPQIR